MVSVLSACTDVTFSTANKYVNMYNDFRGFKLYRMKQSMQMG